MGNTATLRIGCLLGGVLGLVISTTAAAQYVAGPLPAGPRAYRMSGVYAQGYVASPYAHGYVYNPRRLYRQALRYGYPPVFYSWPRAPINLYGYPYYGVARPPIEVWVGPNGYVAPPVYAPPTQEQVPTPADPQLRPQTPVPEPIPAPPSNPKP